MLSDGRTRSLQLLRQFYTLAVMFRVPHSRTSPAVPADGGATESEAIVRAVRGAERQQLPHLRFLALQVRPCCLLPAYFLLAAYALLPCCLLLAAICYLLLATCCWLPCCLPEGQLGPLTRKNLLLHTAAGDDGRAQPCPPLRHFLVGGHVARGDPHLRRADDARHAGAAAAQAADAYLLPQAGRPRLG